MFFFLPLLFAVALGIAGVLFRLWVFKRGFDPVIAFSAFGFVLLTVAVFTYAHAMHGACHGDYDFVHDAFACTRSLEVKN